MRIRCSLLYVLSVVLFAFAFCVLPADAKTSKKNPAPADPVAGLWYTQGHEGGVELYSCGAQICGRFYWLKDDEANGDISRDTHNPDPAKRGEALCGKEFMTGFVPDGKGKYTQGTIYSPRHGANFNADMTLVDPNTLHLHGYLVFTFVGQTQTWTRAATMPKCAMAGQPRG